MRSDTKQLKTILSVLYVGIMFKCVCRCRRVSVSYVCVSVMDRLVPVSCVVCVYVLCWCQCMFRCMSVFSVGMC